ncbi:hypothetical protein SKAU_G00152050 [Synaphobranchus kaupii]|uniref:Uncharacterized protein n=1 Tax=Synaphobranchus kaupii TaxID=118154 RepID=A0A9Q1IYW9_SYNKA|nr:hypothetical protein SKAU_G00152050 [Synaphobranchus kaupii]
MSQSSTFNMFKVLCEVLVQNTNETLFKSVFGGSRYTNTLHFADGCGRLFLVEGRGQLVQGGILVGLYEDDSITVGVARSVRPSFFFSDSGIWEGGGRGRWKCTYTES